MGLFSSSNKDKKKKKENLQKDVIEEEKVDCTNEIITEGNVECKNGILMEENEGEGPNFNEMDEQFNEVESDQLDNLQGQASEISEIRDEMKKLSQRLDDVIEFDILLKKKILNQESTFNQNIEELKRTIVEEKNEEILKLKREINSRKNKEIADAKNILHIVDQIDSIYNFAMDTDNAPLIENLDYTMKVVKKELLEIGIEEISSLGEQFTTKLHICDNAIKDDSKSEDEIVTVIKKGYKYTKDDSILRRAKVIAVRRDDK